MKRINVKSSNFIRNGKSINRKSYTRFLKSTGKVSNVLLKDERFKNRNHFIQNLDDISNVVNDWIDKIIDPNLKITRKNKDQVIYNNLSALSTIKHKLSTSPIRSYEDIVINKKKGNSIIAIKNIKDDTIDRIALIERQTDGKLNIGYVATNPNKLINGVTDPKSLDRLIFDIKKNSGNEKIYTEAIDDRVYNFYLQKGGRRLNDVYNQQRDRYYLEFTENNKRNNYF